MSVLSQPRFRDEAAAFAYLESIVWADGKDCPHCGVVSGRMYDLAGVRGKPSKKSPEGARKLETDDDEARFDDRLRKIVKHKPVEKPE